MPGRPPSSKVCVITTVFPWAASTLPGTPVPQLVTSAHRTHAEKPQTPGCDWCGLSVHGEGQVTGYTLLPSSTPLSSSRSLQLLQRRAEERENTISLFKPKQTHSGLLIQHESVECRETSGGSTPLLPGGLWPLRLKTAPPLSSTVCSSRGLTEPLDSSKRPASSSHHSAMPSP